MSIEMTAKAHHEGRATGRMTTVMRAIPRAEGPRILRLGIVRAGRFVDERLVKERRDVTVGRDEACSFVASCEAHPLFVLRDARYVLSLGKGMSAKVAVDEGVRTVAGPEDVPLGEDGRGRVTLPGGDVLLFQLVAAPLPAQKPVLPLAVRNGEDIDWGLTMIAALSFLLHFGFVGALYSDWVDPLVQDAPTVAGLVDMAKLAPPNVPVEAHETDVAPAPPTKDAPRETTKSAPASRVGKPSDGPAHAPSSGPSAKEAAMVSSAERMAMDVLATMSSGNTATDRALKRGSDIPPVDVSAEAARDTSVGPSSAIATRSTGPVGPTSKNGLAELGNTKREPGHDDAGKVRDTSGPVLDTRIEPARVTMPVSDADRVVSALRPRFRRCYEQGLQSDPGMSGRATLTARIAANGEVSAVDVSVTGLSSGVGQCLARTLKSAQFAAPGGTGSTLTVPVTLIQSSR